MNDILVEGDVAAAQGHLVLLRHGETAWSLSGQHTGRTDIPLTETGRMQAAQAGERLRLMFPEGFERVWTSPLLRARQTASLAGYGGGSPLAEIAEWDYGRAEGRTRNQISEAFGRSWNLWRDGTQDLPGFLEGEREERLPEGGVVHVRNGRGESLQDVADRADDVVERLRPAILEGDNVLLVAHAHILRILTARWIGVDPGFARLLRLDTAHYSILGIYKGDQVIDKWNL
ncbi:histidine phosphatase family protein [uncultured Bifidobacterium sp.]|uniref:histidine phosphatase family protein n=1 Tax=uncultured Bifidobacterium sp. TaxID=165187 RepID=UPI0026204105|nr:histidine phosphatase family protein [uncultured Bifidobacterium sp.]